jgi:hypothetical protein
MKKSALIIGNSNYENVPKLKNPTNDSSDIKDALESIGFETSYGEDLSQKRFRNIVRDFFQFASGDDIILFYYAGHGLQYQNNNYLVPTDCDIRLEHDIVDETISFEYIQKVFNEINSKLSLFILDSCRDNPFAKAISSFSGRNIAFDRGLANTTISVNSQSIIAFATSPNSIAQDNPTEQNGIYTKHLLKHITTDNIKVEDIFKRTTKDVLTDTKHTQEPWTSLKTYDDFYLNGEEQQEVKIVEKVVYKDKIIEKPIEVEKVVEKIVYKEKETVTPTSVGNQKIVKPTEVGVTKEFLDNDLVWQDPDTKLIWQKTFSEDRMKWQEAFEYAKKLNSQNYGGYSDWRVPTLDELKTILTKEQNKNSNGNKYFIKNPLIENMPILRWFLSSTEHKNDSSKAWTFLFDCGFNDWCSKSYDGSVRCVR